MAKVDFDIYSESYIQLMQKQHAKFGDISYYSEYKIDILKAQLINTNSRIKILEFGCGIGNNLKHLINHFNNADVFAYDVSVKSLKIAKKINPSIKLITKKEIDSGELTFDIIFIAGVFHHVAPGLRDSVMQTIFQLLKCGGTLVIFEHNPFNPITRAMVSTCEFDSDAILISKSKMIRLLLKHRFVPIKSRYALFFPPKLKGFNFIEKFIGWLPLGGQYYVLCQKNEY